MLNLVDKIKLSIKEMKPNSNKIYTFNDENCMIKQDFKKDCSN